MSGAFFMSLPASGTFFTIKRFWRVFLDFARFWRSILLVPFSGDVMPEHDLLAMADRPSSLMLLVSVRMSLNPAHRQTQRLIGIFQYISRREFSRSICFCLSVIIVVSE